MVSQRLPLQDFLAISLSANNQTEKVFTVRKINQRKRFGITTSGTFLPTDITQLTTLQVIKPDQHVCRFVEEIINLQLALSVDADTITDTLIGIVLAIAVFTVAVGDGILFFNEAVTSLPVVGILVQRVVLFVRRILEGGGKIGGCFSKAANRAGDGLEDGIAVAIRIPTPSVHLQRGGVIGKIPVDAVPVQHKRDGVRAQRGTRGERLHAFDHAFAMMHAQNMPQRVAPRKDKHPGGIRCNLRFTLHVDVEPAAITASPFKIIGERTTVNERENEQGFRFAVSDQGGGVLIAKRAEGIATKIIIVHRAVFSTDKGIRMGVQGTVIQLVMIVQRGLIAEIPDNPHSLTTGSLIVNLLFDKAVARTGKVTRTVKGGLGRQLKGEYRREQKGKE